MAELENVKRRRDERAVKKAQHEEEMALLARKHARAEIKDLEREEEELLLYQSKVRSEIRLTKFQQVMATEDDWKMIAMKAMGAMNNGDEAFGYRDEVKVDSQARKPKYLNRVHTGYEWNNYKRTHYDHDNPPPKVVQGYKFNIFYPDLLDKTKAPVYTIHKDGDGSAETCIIRFHAGPPYQDIAFRIVNKEWELSYKKGFKCVFEHDMLRL